MEDVIQDETKYFHQVLFDLKEQPMDMRDQLNQTVSNIVTHITFGRRFDYNSEQLDHLLQFEDYFVAFFKTVPAPILRVCIT